MGGATARELLKRAWQVCHELGLTQTDAILTSAALVMQTYIHNYPDAEAQAIYLQQSHHQALWAAGQAKQDKAD